MAIDASPPGGISFEGSASAPKAYGDKQVNYRQSKVGNLFLAAEFARRYPVVKTGIVTNCWNPENLVSGIMRHMPAIVRHVAGLLMLHPAKFGAYTELWAGWSEEAGKAESNGKYIWPWGRFGGFRKDVVESIETGNAAKFWEWCESQTGAFLPNE